MSFDLGELDAIAAEWGGVFDPSVLEDGFGELLTELVDSANSLVDGLRRHMRAPWATRPLHIAFVRSEEVNACVKEGKDADYILITIGTVGKIYGTMFGMLSTPSFLPRIGNSDREDAPNSALVDGFPPMPLQGADGNISAKFYLPADQTRVTFAMQLSSMALHFLLYHEIGHIAAGHLELRKNQGFPTAISEFGTAASQDAALPPFHVLECDADAFAVHIESFVDLHAELDLLWKETYRLEAVSGRDTGFIAHAAAISILFRMLGHDGYAPELLDAKSHPHPAVRSSLTIARSMSLAVGAGRFAMHEFQRLARDSIFHVEETWAALGLPGQQLGESSTWSENVLRLSTELGSEYERWKTNLRKFARLPPRWHNSWTSV